MKSLSMSQIPALAFICLNFGCELPDQVQEGDTIGDVLPISDPAHTVCDPFSDDYNPTYRDHGILGHLYTLQPGQPQYSSTMDYYNNGSRFDANIFFNLLHIPTRPWDRGFTTRAGQTLTNSNGEPVYEWFGVHFQTLVKLGPNNAVGNYQFALLSDDGTLLNMADDLSNFRSIVNNDGNHPTKLACSTTPVYLGPYTEIPTEIFYHQGPRYHIALTILWRPWPANPNDPLCGQQGNSLYFDSTQNPPVPKQAWNDLQARGWRVLEPTNYLLPAGVAENPCSHYDPTNNNQ